jgi:hypothetical protein
VASDASKDDSVHPPSRKKKSPQATAASATTASDASKDDSVHPPPRKKKSPPATAASATAAGDASKDDSGNPPYKLRYKESSESELDDDDDNSGKQRSSTTITTKLMEQTKTDLVKIVLKQRTQIIGLQERLEKVKMIRNQSKKQVKIFQNWTGEETNYADIITQFCKTFLFPRYKFLKEGWNEYDQNRSSLSLLVKQNVAMPEGANYETLWERVVVPTIRLKYINIKCNLNNEIKDAYKSE